LRFVFSSTWEKKDKKESFITKTFKFVIFGKKKQSYKYLVGLYEIFQKILLETNFLQKFIENLKIISQYIKKKTYRKYLMVTNYK